VESQAEHGGEARDARRFREDNVNKFDYVCKRCGGSGFEYTAAGVSSPPQAGSAPDPIDAQIRAEIQLVALISAVKGWAITRPEMTVGELEGKLGMILRFAREAHEEDKQNGEHEPRRNAVAFHALVGNSESKGDRK